VNHGSDFVESLILERPVIADSGVVDEDIESAKSSCDRTGQRLTMVSASNVTYKSD